MNVDACSAFYVAHGRNLVHPLPIVTLVVIIVMRALPSVQHQLALDFRNTLFGYEDIDIGEGPPLGGREIRQKIGCAFQQDDSFIDAGQRAQDALDLPAHGGTLSIGHTQGGQEV